MSVPQHNYLARNIALFAACDERIPQLVRMPFGKQPFEGRFYRMYVRGFSSFKVHIRQHPFKCRRKRNGSLTSPLPSLVLLVTQVNFSSSTLMLASSDLRNPKYSNTNSAELAALPLFSVQNLTSLLSSSKVKHLPFLAS